MELQFIYDQTEDAFIKGALELVNSPFNGGNDRNCPVALILCAEKSQETIELLELDGGDITLVSI